MKKLLFIASLIGNATLLYLLKQDKTKIYDKKERANFYRKKYNQRYNN